MFSLNNMNVDDSGRITFGGVASKIDTKAAIEGILKAKGIPVSRINKEVEVNTSRLGVLNSFNPLLTQLQDASEKLRGALSFDRSNDAFAAKEAFATTVGGSTPATELLGLTMANNAATGNYSFEIVQRAQADILNSNSFTDAEMTANVGALGIANGDQITVTYDDPSNPGTAITTTIDLLATDKISDVVSKINATDSGTKPTGLQAQLIKLGPDNTILQVTSKNTGTANNIQLTDTTGTALQDLRITNGGGNYINHSQQAQDARLRLNGTPEYFQSDIVTDTGGIAGEEIGGGYMKVVSRTDPTKVLYFDNNGAAFSSIPGGGLPAGAHGANVTMDDWVTNVNGGGLMIDGKQVQARKVPDGGGFRLELFVDNGSGSEAFGYDFSVVQAPDQPAGSGILNPTADVVGGPTGFNMQYTYVERSNNTIDDLFTGMTIDLFQAQPGTRIDLEVKNDVTSVKKSIQTFVEAYNEVRDFVTRQNSIDPTTGQLYENSHLSGTAIVTDMDVLLQQLAGSVATGITGDAFQTLSQIGIEFTKTTDKSDPLNRGKLVIDDAKLDSALLNDFEQVQNLFGFSGKVSNSQFRMLDFNNDTQSVPTGTNIDINIAGNVITGVSVDGNVVDATITGGNRFTINEGPLKGATFVYTGDLTTPGTQSTDIETSTGIAHKFFYGMDRFTDTETGVVAAEIDSLEKSNETRNERKRVLDEQLSVERRLLVERFARMEQQLAQLQAKQSQLESLYSSMNKK